MRKTLWFVRSMAVGSKFKELSTHWEWERALLVHQAMNTLAHDIYVNHERPFPVPFQVSIEEEVVGDVIRILATVFVEVEE